MGGFGAHPARRWAQTSPGHARCGPLGSEPTSPSCRGTAGHCSSLPGPSGGPASEEKGDGPQTGGPNSGNGGESSSRSAEKRSAEEEAADLPTKPTKISKFGFAIGSQTTKKASAISIKLGSSPKETVPTLAPKTLSVAAAFNEDEDSEPEEMPPEAKMRMKNIGRDTPTSAGPNSFNKGKHGFSDNQKLWERNIKSHLGNVHDQDN
ncbi:PEST proteolytic signal-containing nuclear protein isoform X2 [Phacochoerus africanus]|uniref:PEST proteolytic signal-containing nuclear protein isoform X2 n=1 Tax=Phacochoerus africanus TaxID=41426 RepID=UPI001FD9EB5D|nr:PEST proteolytic signal-containing nuclear protein isoform X2 [Phacochoerus africanus]